MPTVTEIAREIVVPMGIVGNWLDSDEIKRQVERLTTDALTRLDAFISEDDSLLVPHQAWERENGFSAWRHGYEIQRLNPYLRERRSLTLDELTAAFRVWYDDKAVDKAVRHLVQRLVWLPMEALLRQRADSLLQAYAVRGRALAWIGGHVGEGLGVGAAERAESGWLVPIVRRTTGQNAGTLSLNERGDVLTTPADFRAVLRHQGD